jgi:hypothetical protein
VPLVVKASSLLVAERNRILEAFWISDCTHLLCVDSDLGWPGEAVLAMLQANKDFIAGVYPARSMDPNKNEFLFRPMKNEDDSVITDNHLLKMEYVPAGFMLLNRNCVKKMRDFHKNLYYEPKTSHDKVESGYCLFNTEVWQGEFWGEDYVFCRRAREAGIDIWVDPLIQFDHNGKIGMLLETLRTTNSINM